MFKKLLTRIFTKPSSEANQAPSPRSDSAHPAEDRRTGRRRGPRRPAGDRSGEGQSREAAQGPKPVQERAATDDGDAPKKRRRRRRKPASGRGENSAAQVDERSGQVRVQPTQAPGRPESRIERTEGEDLRLSVRSEGRGSAAGVTTGPQPRIAYFGKLQVSEPVAHALAEMNYTEPTPIQEEVIAPMLAGHDLVGQAQTGTGKTAGFGIPLAEVVDGSLNHVQAIILVPTRELAQQVADELSCIFKYRGIRTVAVYGGAPIARQISGLEAGGQVVIGTPGRVIDLLNRGNLRLDNVKTVVLDEADQMLDIGFLPDIRTILRHTPRERHTALFTATVPTQIRRLIYSYLKDPKTIRVGEESEPVDSVRQMYCEVARRDKLDALREVFETIDAGEQTLVFRRTQEDVDWLVRMLKQKGVAADAIHGGLRQSDRNAVMQAFRDGKVKLLVSTNLTSRGIDVPAVAHVINYDIPEQVEEYVHRIGRTARMGREGTAVTFVAEWDTEFFDAIRDHVGAERLEEIHLRMYNRQKPTAAVIAGPEKLRDGENAEDTAARVNSAASDALDVAQVDADGTAAGDSDEPAKSD
jgi:ATP-dependent RNA helicase DeaD